MPQRRLDRVLAPGEGVGDPRFWVAFTRDGKRLLSSTIIQEKNGLYSFQVNSWERELIADAPSLINAGPPAVSPDGRLVACSLSPRQVRLTDPATGRCIAHITTLNALDPVPRAFSPDGTQLAVSTNQGLMQVWDLRRIREYLAKNDLDWDSPAYLPAK